MALDIRSRIEEIRSRIATRGVLGQGIAAGGGIAPGGIKVFSQEEGKRPLEQILERVRARVEEVRKRVAEFRPGPAPAPPTESPATSPLTVPSTSPQILPPEVAPVRPTARIKTY